MKEAFSIPAGKGSLEVVASVILEDMIGMDTSTRLSIAPNARMGQAPAAAVEAEARAEAGPAPVAGPAVEIGGGREFYYPREAGGGQQAVEEAGENLFLTSGSKASTQWRHIC